MGQKTVLTTWEAAQKTSTIWPLCRGGLAGDHKAELVLLPSGNSDLFFLNIFHLSSARVPFQSAIVSFQSSSAHFLHFPASLAPLLLCFFKTKLTFKTTENRKNKAVDNTFTDQIITFLGSQSIS